MLGFEEMKAELTRHVRIAICLVNVRVALSDLKDLDPGNAALYADLQDELAARK